MRTAPAHISRAAPALIGLAAVGCYVNALAGGFVLDDKEIVRDNVNIRSVLDLPRVWLSEWWATRGADAEQPDPGRDRLYRPLTLFTFAVNYALDRPGADGRPRPLGFHAVNVLLHAGVSLLVWLLARRLGLAPPGALLAGALFAVHPVHCEAVANGVGRAELLSALFLLLGMLALRPAAGPLASARVARAAAAFCCALLAKESAICYPVLAGLLLVRGRFAPAAGQLAQPPRRAGPVVTVAILLLPLAAYLPLRFVALGGQLVRTSGPSAIHNPLADADVAGRALGALTVAGHYARLMLFPMRLQADYGRDTIVAARVDAETVFGALAVALGSAALLGFRRRGVWGDVALLTGMLLASYALISNTIQIIGVSLAERLFYFPSVLVCLLIARLGAACGDVIASLRARRAAAGVATAIVIALAARTIARNPAWRCDLSLAQAGVAADPRNAILQSFLGRALLEEAETTDAWRQRRERLLRADHHLERSLRIVLRNPWALGVRARVRVGLLDYAGARAMLAAGLQMFPKDPPAARLLAQLQTPEYSDAAVAALLAERLAAAPDDPVLHERLAELALRRGDAATALDHAQRAAAIDPAATNARRLCGEALALLGRGEEALAALRGVIAADPQNWEAHLNLSAILSASDAPAALRHAEIAERLRPDEFAADSNLAEALALCGRVSEALQRYRRLLQNLPPEAAERAFVRDRIAELEAPP